MLDIIFNVNCQMLDDRCPMADVRCQEFNIKGQLTDAKCQMSRHKDTHVKSNSYTQQPRGQLGKM